MQTEKNLSGNSASVKPIQKLLIANRNEIAMRILRAARELSIPTVAVYSEADRHALHVAQADEAYCIGPAPSLESYLNIDTLIQVCLKCGADAVHPGYGFVSENPLFAKACEDNGIRLVGPTSQAIADMADKARAKAIATQAGLPCIPGYSAEIDTPSASSLLEAARRIGFPVMIKALAGGGGRGMRLVMKESDFAAQLQSAQLEALNAFNDQRVMLEKAIINPRHIEIQVLADQYGHAIHLGERDCSVQRRHQKIVEEAPSPAVGEALRARMGEAALKLVRSTRYVGAGTVEFLLDASGDFYFIEMNTRLQVEHGVTEAITGIDLVQWQLRIAAGEPLTLRQEDVRFNGHSIQGRLCAEDPAKDFLPQTGPVLHWQPCEASRCDHALRKGLEVSPWYDSLLAKVIVHAPTRLQACEKLADALARTELIGFEHNAEYLRRIASHPQFQSGEFGTAFLAEHADSLLSESSHEEELFIAAVALATGCLQQSAWGGPFTAFSSTRALSRPLRLAIGQRTVNLSVSSALGTDHGRFELLGLESPVNVASWSACHLSQNLAEVQCHINELGVRALIAKAEGGVWVRRHRSAKSYWVQDQTLLNLNAGAEGTFQPLVKSPMSGKITQVLVEPGQTIEAGTVLLCLEAMKMEHRITCKFNAVVEAVLVKPGEQMNLNQLMVQLKEA